MEKGINHQVHMIDILERFLEAVPLNNIQVILDVVNLRTLDNWRNQEAIIDEAIEKLADLGDMRSANIDICYNLHYIFFRI